MPLVSESVPPCKPGDREVRHGHPSVGLKEQFTDLSFVLQLILTQLFTEAATDCIREQPYFNKKFLPRRQQVKKLDGSFRSEATVGRTRPRLPSRISNA